MHRSLGRRTAGGSGCEHVPIAVQGCCGYVVFLHAVVVYMFMDYINTIECNGYRGGWGFSTHVTVITVTLFYTDCVYVVAILFDAPSCIHTHLSLSLMWPVFIVLFPISTGFLQRMFRSWMPWTPCAILTYLWLSPSGRYAYMYIYTMVYVN